MASARIKGRMSFIIQTIRFKTPDEEYDAGNRKGPRIDSKQCGGAKHAGGRLFSQGPCRRGGYHTALASLDKVRLLFQFRLSQIEEQRQAERDSDREHSDHDE